MPGKIPPKQIRAVGSLSKAIATSALAAADARQRGKGINLETTFPEGRMLLVIGGISVSVSQPTLKKGKS